MHAIPAHRRRARSSPAAALVLLFLADPAHARPLFTAPSLLYPTAARPVSVAMADLDRDGHGDLVVSNAVDPTNSQGSVSVYLGLGDGTFRPRVDYPLPGSGEGIAIADLDGDGRPDVVVMTRVGRPDNAADASVLLGNGDGTLRTPTPFAAGNGLRSVCIADLDRDGRLDLVTETSALLGNADGTFGPPHVFGTAADTWAAVADFNGDGILDVATSNLAAGWADPDVPPPVAFVRLGRGDGTFGPAAGFGAGGDPLSIAAADMDRDGHVDLIVANWSPPDAYESFSRVTQLRGNGDGTFTRQGSFVTGSSPYAVVAADLDGDGWPDIATTNFNGDPDFDANSVTVLLANGHGNFHRMLDLPGGGHPRALAAGDLDGDAIADLVVVNEGSNTLSVMLGSGLSSSGARRFPTPSRARDLHPANLDYDGELDLVVECGERTTTIATLRGNGDGTFEPAADFGSWGSYISAGVGDLNADGLSDVAVADAQANTVSTLPGNGNGTFGAATELPTGQYPQGVEIVDLNEDRFPEMIVANGIAGTLSVFPGRGDGTFGTAVDYATGRFPRLLAKADVNADGHWDLVVGDPGDATVSVFLGRGDGTLAPRIVLPTGYAQAAAVADIDGDGKLDLAVVGGASIHLHRGHGDGTFDTGVVVAAHEDAVDVVCTDLDGDGKADLAVTYPYSQTVSILLGHGDLTFEPAVDYGVHAWGIAAADVNHDGATDLVVAGGEITVMLNNRAVPVPVPPAPQPSRLALRIPAVSHVTGQRLPLAVTLPDPGPATLQLLDLAGRIRASRRLDGLGAGPHDLALDARGSLAPGIYFVRLTQAARVETARTFVLR